MATLLCSNGEVQISEEDIEFCALHSWTIGKHGYARTSINMRPVDLQVLIGRRMGALVSDAVHLLQPGVEMLVWTCHCIGCELTQDTQKHRIHEGIYAEFGSKCIHWRKEAQQAANLDALQPAPEQENEALKCIMTHVLRRYHEFCTPTDLSKVAHKVATGQVTAVLALVDLERRRIIT